MSEQFSNPEQALIERLRRAPQPELSSEAREIIRARVLDALNHPPIPAPHPTQLSPVVVIIAVLIGAALITGGIIFILSQRSVPPITPTIPATHTLVSPTPSASATSSPTVTVSPSSTLTLTASLTATGQVTVSASPLSTATARIITVVEGPIERIDGNIVVIYGIEITIAPNDPILTIIKVGDVLRVKSDGASATIIVTPTVEAANNDVNVNPPSGEGWQDDGTCAHPPPDWAPANGWRRRCEGQDKDSNKNNGNGNGNKDDDDD